MSNDIPFFITKISQYTLNYTLYLGVPAIAVGLSALSLLASIPPRSKNTEVCSPKSEVRAPQRMPLQSLTHWENSIIKEL